ncbi:MAG: Sulfate transporter/antisigma-factor antagonist [Pseudonocardia sp.]|jgi:anti-anti-sigma factor|nr:Sulfate transporter/antisigma-factor antagonist [Pseudonocardia sp.]
MAWVMERRAPNPAPQVDVLHLPHNTRSEYATSDENSQAVRTVSRVGMPTPCGSDVTMALDTAPRTAGTKYLHVAGEIDSLTGGDLEAEIYQELEDQPLRLIVDLSLAGFLGSTGLAILCRAKDVCLRQGTELSFVGGGRTDIVRQLQIVGLERLFIGNSCLEP